MIQVNCAQEAVLCQRFFKIKEHPTILYYKKEMNTNKPTFGAYGGKRDAPSMMSFLRRQIGPPVRPFPKTAQVKKTMVYYFNGLDHHVYFLITFLFNHSIFQIQ